VVDYIIFEYIATAKLVCVTIIFDSHIQNTWKASHEHWSL